jgi:hypothetical protein
MNDIGDWIWVLVPTAPFIFLGFRQWLKLKERQIDAQSSATAERTAQYAAQTERLEQRVRVLERIITEKGVDLASQIEDLRHRPLN